MNLRPSTIAAFVMGMPSAIYLACTSTPPITPRLWSIRFGAAFVLFGMIGHAFGQSFEEGPPRTIFFDIYQNFRKLLCNRFADKGKHQSLSG